MATDRTRKAKLKVIDVNPHISCILCGGYFVDATTITECLHSFCRACIVRYLETSKYCPVCEVQVHKTRPLRCIRSDKILQNIVYKLVPGLYPNEMKRRRELYASQPPEALKESRDEEDRGEGIERRSIYSPDEIFSLALQYQCEKTEASDGGEEEKSDNIPKRRFLRCPAGIRISHLKKFIRVKFAIPRSLQVVLQYENELLENDYTLMDVAYISVWKWTGPLELTFRVIERAKIPPKPSPILSIDVDTDVKVQETESQAAEPQVSSTDVCSSVQESSTENREIVCDDPFEGHCDGTREQTVSNCDAVTERLTPDVPPLNNEPEEEETDKSSTHANEENDSHCGKDEEVEEEEEIMDVGSPVVASKALDDDNTTSAASIDSDTTKDAKQELLIVEKDAEVEEVESPPPKVPKLTIPLTPKILQMAAQHAEDERMELDNDLFEGRLVIAEPEASPKEYEDDCSNSKDSSKLIGLADLDDTKKDREISDDYEVDSGRGSDSSSRAEARSLCGDDDIGSPASSTVRTPDLEKPNSFAIPSPSSIPSPTKISIEDPGDKPKLANEAHKNDRSNSTPVVSQKSDFGVLDLSTCRRKRDEDGMPISRPKQIANPPVLDKFRQTTPCLPLPTPPSYKLFPPVLPHTNMYKKPEYSRGTFRYNRGSTLTVINPDPNSCRPKIVIKNLDPRPEHRHHHHHHHHHHSHHHQKT